MSSDHRKYGWYRRRHRVDFQVFVMTAVIVILSCGLTFFLSFNFTYTGMIGGLENRANSIHDYTEEILDVRMFEELEGQEDEESPIYIQNKDLMERVRRASGIRYLYTAKKTEDGRFVYLVDALHSENSDFRHLGDVVEPERVPDMQKALDGEAVMPEKIHHTSFGDIFISYYPMHKGEEIVGILGIEFSAGGQYTTYRKMAIAAPVIIGLFCIMAAVIAVVLFRRISNPAYHDMANTDFLTGLKNRNAFEVDLNNLECTRQKSGICLVSVDLDNLKTVNDTMGDAAGDSYIKACTKILKDNLDSAGTLYRTGGDEFIMILEDTDEEKAAAMMERIYEDCRGCTGLKNVAVSLSAGYAFYEEPDDTLEDTFRRADEKMYECKKKKR